MALQNLLTDIMVTSVEVEELYSYPFSKPALLNNIDRQIRTLFDTYQTDDPNIRNELSGLLEILDRIEKLRTREPRKKISLNPFRDEIDKAHEERMQTLERIRIRNESEREALEILRNSYVRSGREVVRLIAQKEEISVPDESAAKKLYREQSGYGVLTVNPEDIRRDVSPEPRNALRVEMSDDRRNVMLQLSRWGSIQTNATKEERELTYGELQNFLVNLIMVVASDQTNQEYFKKLKGEYDGVLNFGPGKNASNDAVVRLGVLVDSGIKLYDKNLR